MSTSNITYSVSAMQRERKAAIRAVLTGIDNNRQPNTTYVDRCRRVEQVYDSLSEDLRDGLPRWPSLYNAVQYILHDPRRAREQYNNKDRITDVVMQRLFAEGSGMLTQTCLQAIRYTYRPSSQYVRHRNSGQSSSGEAQAGKKRAASRPLQDQSVPASKKTKLGSHPPSPAPDQPSDGDDDHDSGVDAPTENQTCDGGDEEQPRPAKSAFQIATEGVRCRAIRDAFDEVAEMVEIAPFRHAFAHHHGSRLAQLTIQPTDELNRMYMRAFGAVKWKPIAIELQSTNVLDAKDFLRCIIWSFIDINIFTQPGPNKGLVDLLESSDSDVSLRAAFQASGADHDRSLREAIATELDDRVFQEHVIDPESDVLAHNLMLVLEEHLPCLEHRGKRELRTLAREVCRAALLLRGKCDTVERRYSLTWFGEGLRDVPNGKAVAFTLTPGLKSTAEHSVRVEKVRFTTSM